ncbi:MAG: type II toxin-antitoxin system HicB family antitoxin [Rickettsiales bacterium]
MHNVKYVIYKEGNYFVTKCLNFELSTFGKTLDEAQKNMKEALELYFEDDDIGDTNYVPVELVMVAEQDIKT